MKAKIKLFLWFITISIIPLLILGGFSYYLISAKISRQYEENINNINMGIYNMVDTQQKVLMQWMDSSATAFSEKLRWLGPIRFDHSAMVDIGGYKLPTWYIGNQKITGDNTLVDILISKQKLPATLFQLHDNKFIRVSSNVRQPDGNRIVGTIVDSGPIYEKIINGQIWRGRGSVEGIMHGMIYQPIFDSSNNLVGAFVLGRREQEFELLSAIKNIVVGETGFVAVMDPEGVFIIHPTMQGKSAANFGWAQEILRKKNGSVNYTDSNGREKIAYYKYYEPWNWYIVTGSFVSEIFNTTRELFKGLLLLCLVVIMLSAAIAYAMSITFFRPIDALIEVMKQVRKGNLTVKLHHTQNDEYMVVATALNDMLDTISLLIGRLVNNSSKLKEASLNLIDDITDSRQALTVMETGVNSIRDSVQLSHQLAEGDNDPSQELLADMEEIKAYIALIQPEATLPETSNALQIITEMVDGVRNKFLAQAAIDRNINIPFTLQNKINNLDIELAKLQLLTKHIFSSANSLDDIALSLDKDVNIFKLDIPGKVENC
jgi:methyl-accepting chemotaxis protein